MCNLRTCLFFKNLGEKSAHPYNCLDYYDERTLLKYICPFGSMDIRLFQTVVYQKYGQYSQPLKFQGRCVNKFHRHVPIKMNTNIKTFE